MSNKETTVAVSYHEVTKHSYVSVHTSTHHLDFANKAYPFKVYLDCPRLPLQHEVPSVSEDTISMVGSPRPPEKMSSLDLTRLAQILVAGAGVTRRIPFPPSYELRDEYFRTYASAGALYPVELYMVAGQLPGLESGVYHFLPRDAVLQQLRKGDYRLRVAQAAVNPHIAEAAAILVQAAIFWRSAWKYQARAYRYCFWDAGTMAANLCALITALRLHTEVRVGFADHPVNRLLGVDGESEGALTLLPLWAENAAPPPTTTPPAPPLGLKAQPLSSQERDHPEIVRLHQSSLLQPEEVALWRPSPITAPPTSRTGTCFPLQPILAGDLPAAPLSAVLRRRGSTRRFSHESITFGQLSTILTSATRGISADFLTTPSDTLLDLYLIANAVDGLPRGAYHLNPREESLIQLKAGNLRPLAGYLCLEQALAADASAVVFFLADLSAVLARFGNRGYRAVQLEAGLVGGKLYLAAYALGLGASGLTFYDDEVTDFFAPKKAAIFVVALGVPAKRLPLA